MIILMEAQLKWEKIQLDFFNKLELVKKLLGIIQKE